MEYKEVDSVAVAVVEAEPPHAVTERNRERLFFAEREDRKAALAFAMTGTSGHGYQRPANDKRSPDEIVKAAEKYYAFITAGREKTPL